MKRFFISKKDIDVEKRTRLYLYSTLVFFLRRCSMMDFDPTRARANVEVRVFVYWRLLSCAMLLVLLSCLGALFSLRARSVFLLSLFPIGRLFGGAFARALLR